MTSVLLNEDNVVESEAAHGTVTRHYRVWEKGGATSTNPVASIFAWAGGLHHRANLDKNQALNQFSAILKKATVDTIEDGIMTKDLAIVALNRSNLTEGKEYVVTEKFMEEVDKRFKVQWAKVVQ
jgi:isocitrate dehydrogenase